MKHLKIFETGTAFEAVKANLEKPWVVLTEDDKNVHMMESGEPTPTYEYVDLGLPSGLKWAKCNIGATSETDYGLYFQWGATEGYTAEQIENGEKVFNFGTTPYQTNKSADTSTNAIKFTKYLGSTSSRFKDPSATDGDAEKTVLDPIDDAAVQRLGNGKRMPTSTEYQTLKDNTYWQWVDSDTDVVVKVINDDGTIEAKTVQYPAGYFVYKVKDDAHKGQMNTADISALYDYNYHPAVEASPEKEADTHIFFPAGGYAENSILNGRGSYGSYWSSSLYTSSPDNCYYLYFHLGRISPQNNFARYFGRCVRPVSE